jgi:hypothetical protein
MSLFYNEVDRRKWIYQPNFSRSRQKYRGNRESYSINLEISQFVFDVYNIHKKMTTFVETTMRYSSYISRGASISDVEYSGTGSNVMTGLLDMSSEVEDLKNRVKEMERKYV